MAIEIHDCGVLEVPQEVIDAAETGQLVMFVGAGASMLVGCPSWAGLSEKILRDLCEEGLINFSDLDQLLTISDPKKRLSIAKNISKPRPLNISKFLDVTPTGENIYDFLNSLGCPFVTTNYDTLLIPDPDTEDDETITGSDTQRIYQPDDFEPDLLNSASTVVHLHGCKDDYSSMVVTTSDYLEHYDNERVQFFLKELFDKKVVVFIGYGLDEAEILEHIFRRGKADKKADISERRRFLLQPYFVGQQPLAENLSEYYLDTFGVHLIAYQRDKEDYKGLETIMRQWSESIDYRKSSLVDDFAFMDEVLGDE